MTNSNSNSSHAEKDPTSEEERWTRLFENIRRVALKKSDAMVNAPFADDEDFDRDARILRTLMGSAEIAARMRRDDKKENALNDDQRAPRAYTDEELRAVYRRIVRTVDDAGRRSETQPAPSDTGSNAGRGGENLVGGICP